MKLSGATPKMQTHLSPSRILLTCFIFFIIFKIPLFALPGQVLLIRYAEGLPKENSLSQKGRQRAAAYTIYFTETEELLRFGPPVAIYAMKPSKDAPSQKAIETSQPLSEKLQAIFNTNYVRDDYQRMVEEIKNNPLYTGKTVLICWDHAVIPQIARAFGALQTPFRWPQETFDQTWLINFSATGRSSFQNYPQRLMFGDSPT